MNLGASDLTADEKRALLKHLLVERGRTGAGLYAVAPGQIALWFLQRLLPDSHSYNLALAVRIRPSVDIGPFQKVLDQLVERHPALRTVFPERDGQPMRHVLVPSHVPLRVVEMRDQSELDVYAAVCADHRRPFRLEESPFAVTLFRRTDEDVLLINVHHIVFDGQSLQVLFEEMRTLYEAELCGSVAALPILPAQYTDFVLWQTNILQGADGQRLLDYWREALSGDVTPLQISSASTSPTSPPERGESLSFTIDAELTAAVHTLAKNQRATLYMVMMAAMQVLLYQFSHQPDITIGTPVSLRPNPAWVNVIGYFINMLPIRGRIAARDLFVQHLAQVRETVLDALEHQALPFSYMVDRLRIRRDPNRSPIFQAMLNVQTSSRTSEISRLFAPGEQLPGRFGRSQITAYVIPQQQAQFEIAIEMTEMTGILCGNFKYQTDRYSGDTARQMLDAFLSILKTIVIEPDITIGNLISSERDTFEV